MEWKDVDVYICGHKIEGVNSINYNPDSKCAFPKLTHASYSGTVKLSGKQAHEIRRFLTGYKKIRLPRKMKKRLKKAQRKRIEQWLSYYFPDITDFGRGNGKIIVSDYIKALHSKDLTWTRGMFK